MDKFELSLLCIFVSIVIGITYHNFTVFSDKLMDGYYCELYICSPAMSVILESMPPCDVPCENHTLITANKTTEL